MANENKNSKTLPAELAGQLLHATEMAEDANARSVVAAATIDFIL